MNKENQVIEEEDIKKLAAKSKRALLTSRVFSYILLIILSFLCLFPFYILIVNATRTNAQINLGFSLVFGKNLGNNWTSLKALASIPIVRGLGNSIFISVCVTLLTTYFSALTAYGLNMYNFKGKKFAFVFIMLIMMVPLQISTLGFLKILNQVNLMDSFVPLIVPSLASPVVFFFMYQYMESVLPREMIEAARVDGSGEFRTFNQIVLPIMKPALAVQGIFAFVGSWNNYFLPALVLETNEKKTVPVLIAMLRSADYAKFDLGAVYLMIAIAIIPLIIIYLFLSKHIIGGIALGSVKG